MAEVDIFKKIALIEEELEEIKSMVRSKNRFFSSDGGWEDLDTDKLKADIYKARKISTRDRAVFK